MESVTLRKEQAMYKVVFEYANGRKGVCMADGKAQLFNTEQEAAAFAAELNSCISEDVKQFFPAWSVEKS